MVIRLPVLIWDVPLTVSEFKWMLLGDQIGFGNLMYSDIWDNSAPLAALVYWLINLIFGQSQLAYYIISAIFITIHCAIFNSFLNRNKTYNEVTYVPTLTYGIFSCLFVDFFSLSPALLSMTFILLVVRNIFYRIDSITQDLRILKTGIYLGVAVLFYLPSAVFILAALLSYLFFASLNFRHLLLLAYGIFVPLALASAFFFWRGGLYEFYNQFIQSQFYLNDQYLISKTSLAIIAGVPAFFLLWSWLKLAGYRRYTKYQASLQQIMFFHLLAASLSFFMVKERVPYQLFLFVPWIAFYVAHLLLIIKKGFLAELVTLFLLALVLGLNYGSVKKWPYISEYISTEGLFLKENPLREMVKGKTIQVFGDHVEYYQGARVGMPYLNWRLSARELTKTEYYDNLAGIHEHFNNYNPYYIIDKAGIMADLQKRIPIVDQKYKPVPDSDGEVYQLKNPEKGQN